MSTKATIHVIMDSGVREVPIAEGASVREALEAADVGVRWGCTGNGACGLCTVKVRRRIADPPTKNERLLLSPEQIDCGVRLACQLSASEDLWIEVLGPGMGGDTGMTLPAEVAPSMFGEQDAIRSGEDGQGVAIDVGTTHVRVSLCDLASGARLAGRVVPNPQARWGADVVTRLAAAGASGQLAGRMAKELTDAVRGALHEACASVGIDPRTVSRACVVGNTPMLILLTGTDASSLDDPRSWTQPIDCHATGSEALSEAFGIQPGAAASVAQPLAGFVGSDLLAAVLDTRLVEGPAGLLIDFGTNSEIALWDGTTLRVTSAAGGPAFESFGLGCGAPAGAGAVSGVRRHEGTGELDLEVMGGGPALGLCGSGFVDLMAVLRDAGDLTELGKLERGHADGYVVQSQGCEIRLTGRDVDTFQRAKAAIGTGVMALLAEAGLRQSDVQRVYVCGAFGRQLDIESAKRIGLLPDLPSDRFELRAEGALCGCQRLLTDSSDVNGAFASIRDKAVLINLAERADFDELFLENLYLRPLGAGRAPVVERRHGPQLLEAFVKSVQYIVSLETQQDVRDHAGALITTHLPAQWVAFARREAQGIVIDHCTLAPAACDVLTARVEEAIADVLDTGFLACEVTRSSAPSMTAFLAIVSESRPQEVMLVGHTTPDPIPKDLLDVYLAVAGIVGTTLERLRSRAELERHRSHLEDLVRQRTSELERTNAQLSEEIAERRVAQLALHAERERLSITLRSIGDGVIATDTESRVTLLNGVAENMTGWGYEEAMGRPIGDVFVIVNEQTGEPAQIPVEAALRTGAVAELANHTVLIARDGRRTSVADSCAPIRVEDGSIIGAVLVFRDVSEQHQSERLREALNTINTEMGSSLDADAIMRAAIEGAAVALGCEKAIIQVRRDGVWEVNHASEAVRALTGERFSFDGGLGRFAQTASVEPLVLSGARLQEMVPDWSIDALGARSITLMPVAIRGEVVAALEFVNVSPESPHIAIQLDFIRKLGASLSFALDNAQLYATEREIATTLQAALLSVPPRIAGMDLGHLYRSATNNASVGGDFYDIFDLGGGCVGLLLGDVSGKGVQAATLTALVRNTIRALAYENDSPATVIRKTNVVIFNATSASTFVTLIFAVLDTASGRLVYCSAGQTRSIVKRQDGDVELLEVGSSLAGAFPAAIFQDGETTLQLGDTLILYTDGITEARRSGTFFGEERLVATVRKLRKMSVRDVPEAIFDEVLRYTRGALSDDVAILAVARVEKAEE